MDHLSQIQNYILAITKNISKTIEKLQGVPLSPVQATALGQLYSDVFAAAEDFRISDPNAPTPTLDRKVLSQFVLFGLEKWKNSADEMILAVSEIFARIAEADLLMAALPIEFSSEDDQLQELALLKGKYDNEEKKLRLAEADALYCKKLLDEIVEENGLRGYMTVDYPVAEETKSAMDSVSVTQASVNETLDR